MPKKSLSSYHTCRRWTEEEAREAIAALDASGLSTAAFAVREGLDPQRLYWWRRRVATPRASVPAFVEVRTSSDDCEQVEVLLRSGRVLRVSAAIDAATLRRLVEALDREAPC